MSKQRYTGLSTYLNEAEHKTMLERVTALETRPGTWFRWLVQNAISKEKTFNAEGSHRVLGREIQVQALLTPVDYGLAAKLAKSSGCEVAEWGRRLIFAALDKPLEKTNTSTLPIALGRMRDPDVLPGRILAWVRTLQGRRTTVRAIMKKYSLPKTEVLLYLNRLSRSGEGRINARTGEQHVFAQIEFHASRGKPRRAKLTV